MIGKITSINQDFLNGGITIILNLSNCSVQELQTLSAFDSLQIDMKKYRKPRSKDANAYFHVLVGKIADELGISKIRTKNILIGRYGQPEMMDGDRVHIKTEIDVAKMLEQESMHCVPCGVKVENGKELYFYTVYRGSHTYNTKEMSTLIDGAVSEAKEIGIETMPPEELKRMVQEWKA